MVCLCERHRTSSIVTVDLINSSCFPQDVQSLPKFPKTQGSSKISEPKCAITIHCLCSLVAVPVLASRPHSPMRRQEVLTFRTDSAKSLTQRTQRQRKQNTRVIMDGRIQRWIVSHIILYSDGYSDGYGDWYDIVIGYSDDGWIYTI